MSAKDILKYNRDIIISELENKLIGLFNSFRQGNEKNIKEFADFSHKLNKGEVPGDIAYKQLIFNNSLDVPFADEDLEELLFAADILMSLEQFPTIVPKAYMRALNNYERRFLRATTISNRNLANTIVDMALKLIMTLHEHQDYTHISGEDKTENEEPVEAFKKKEIQKGELTYFLELLA